MQKNSWLGMFTGAMVTAIAISSNLPGYAADLEQERKALDLIADFADKLCKDVNQKGGSKTIDVSGDAKAKLQGVVSKLADLGFEGAAKYKSDNYEGLIRTDLLAALKDNNACRLQVWNDLKVKLLQQPINPAGGKLEKQEVGINVSVMGAEQSALYSIMHVGYGITKNSKQIAISPNLGYLDLVRKGGPITPVLGRSPFHWDLPTLDIKVVNNTSKTIFINEAIIDVERSQLDPEPILLVIAKYLSNPFHFTIRNEGWGAASDVKIAFNIEPLKKEQSPQFSGPFQHSVALLRIDESENVDISTVLASSGVKVDELKSLTVVGWKEGEPPMVRVIGKNNEDLTMTEDEFEKLFGPFPGGGAFVSGIISYNSILPSGERKLNELCFSTTVWMYEELRAGAALPPSYAYSTKLEVDGKMYNRRVNMSQELKPGETDRFTLKIGVEKSSLHAFNLRLVYNGSKVLQAGSFQLAMFVPRTGAKLIHQDYRGFPAAACVTQLGQCPLMIQPGKNGSPCVCNTMYGQIPGVMR